MKEKKEHNRLDENLGSMLKQLPKINASGDFETRLQRRIVEESNKAKNESVFSLFLFSERIPAFATSIVALVAVSVISYYVFLRTGTPQASPHIEKSVSGPAEQRNLGGEFDHTTKSVNQEAQPAQEVPQHLTNDTESKKFKKIEHYNEPRGFESQGKSRAGTREPEVLMDDAAAKRSENESPQAVEVLNDQQVVPDREEPQPTLQMNEIAPSSAPSIEKSMKGLENHELIRGNVLMQSVKKEKSSSFLIQRNDSLKVDSLKRDSLRKALQMLPQKKPKP